MKSFIQYNEHTVQTLASAEDARKEMQNLKADNEKLLQEARAERDEMLKEARQLKEKMIAEAEGDAQEKADKIAVIDKGEICEVGNHNELIKRQGRYKEFCEKQFIKSF